MEGIVSTGKTNAGAYYDVSVLDAEYRRRLAKRKQDAIEQAAYRLLWPNNEIDAMSPNAGRWFRRRYPKRARAIEQAVETRSLRAKADYHRRRMH
jgi:hypothetical protein